MFEAGISFVKIFGIECRNLSVKLFYEKNLSAELAIKKRLLYFEISFFISGEIKIFSAKIKKYNFKFLN